MSETAIGSNWTDVRNDLFTQEEISATDLRVAIISESIRRVKWGEATRDCSNRNGEEYAATRYLIKDSRMLRKNTSHRAIIEI